MPKAKASNSTPASPQPIRALTLFETLPPGHKTFRVPDDGSSPHLKEREFAVIDTTDREPQHGELFLKQERGHSRRRRIVQVTAGLCQITATGPKSPVWWLCDLAGFRQVGAHSGVPLFAGLSDGPYDAGKHYLQKQFVGRIVGYATDSFGHVIAPEAGWEEDEGAGNAAFDPVEYLDVLIGAGYQLSVSRRRNGSMGLQETFPEEALTEAQDAAYLAARTKYCAASKAHERVVAECLRRGLVD